MAELRLEVLLEPERTGATVAKVCRRHGISRETYYQYRRRYLAEGLPGLEDRSRTPHTSPARREASVEERICQLRTAHLRWVARRIQAEHAALGMSLCRAVERALT